MGGKPSKETEIVKPESFNQESLVDDSFLILNIYGASSAGGALMVVVVLALACLGYAMARYRDYLRRVKHRAATTLEILKPTCPA